MVDPAFQKYWVGRSALLLLLPLLPPIRERRSIRDVLQRRLPVHVAFFGALHAFHHTLALSLQLALNRIDDLVDGAGGAACRSGRRGCLAMCRCRLFGLFGLFGLLRPFLFLAARPTTRFASFGRGRLRRGQPQRTIDVDATTTTNVNVLDTALSTSAGRGVPADTASRVTKITRVSNVAAAAGLPGRRPPGKQL